MFTNNITWISYYVLNVDAQQRSDAHVYKNKSKSDIQHMSPVTVMSIVRKVGTVAMI